MTSHLNFFVPFASAPAWHENQLTRALLVVLRYCPIAHQAWLNLVSPGHQLASLPAAEFATQRQRVVAGEYVADGEAIAGISVWLAPDAAPVKARMEPSERQQVLDAVISYGGDLVVVIENKIGWCDPTEQPHRINLHGAPVTFDAQPRSVPWQEVLGTLSDLVERDLVHGAERLLIGDFLDLVENYFPNIGPYSTLSRCGSHRFRLERRLDVVQGIAIGVDEGKGLGWRLLDGSPKIFMARLGLTGDGSEVSLDMYPADTLGQARAFYADAGSVRDVLSLRANGWRMRPNFHWGVRQGGYAWATSQLELEPYCDYWTEHIASARELERAEWPATLARLWADGILDEAGQDLFHQQLTSSQRKRTHPRPGLLCEYRWPLREAARLDDRGQLVDAVRHRINQMLGALRASRPVPHSSTSSD